MSLGGSEGAECLAGQACEWASVGELPGVSATVRTRLEASFASPLTAAERTNVPGALPTLAMRTLSDASWPGARLPRTR
jgi:hypothetical protein